jgi:hypothetical protein
MVVWLSLAMDSTRRMGSVTARIFTYIMLLTMVGGATSSWLPQVSLAQATCQFVLGFATVSSLIGPVTAGTCLEDQRFTPEGNAEQRTSAGLLVWRKSDNWTAFTDGHRTWIIGPNGLQQRLNTERFPWESDATGFLAPNGIMAPVPASATTAGAPVLAWYYAQFSQNLPADIQHAAAASIDALVISETGGADLTPYLDAVRGTSVHVALGVEPLQYTAADALVSRLRHVLSGAAQDPAFMRYQGKPVFVFWNLPGVPLYPGRSPQDTWVAIRAAVDPQRSSVWIGEGGDPNTTLSYLPAFDGLHLYSIAWAADPSAALSGWAQRVRRADPSKLWVATVMPGGFFGSGSDPSQWQYRERRDGEYYRASWRAALATQPAMVIITSYNETAERTEIHFDPVWGTRYLDITREMAGLR